MNLIRKATSGFKARASIVVISVLLIIYMIPFLPIDIEDILLNLSMLKVGVTIIDHEPNVELSVIIRKSSFSVLKSYLFGEERDVCTLLLLLIDFSLSDIEGCR